MKNIDEHELEQLYMDMYSYMTRKDTKALGRLLSEDFVLVHITGLQQSKEIFLNAIDNGTLNYHSCEHENIEVTIHGEYAIVTGKSRVCASVFGGGKHTWPLQLTLILKKNGNDWKIANIKATTY